MGFLRNVILVMDSLLLFTSIYSVQYNLPEPIGLLRADNNLPPWRPGIKEVPEKCKSKNILLSTYVFHYNNGNLCKTYMM